MAIHRTRTKKPQKPYPEFPLYAHAGGVWAKRIRRHLYYFGPWADPDGALERYLKEKDFLYAGQAPPRKNDGVTIHEVANRYLESQLQKMQVSEITPRHYEDCRRDAKRVITAFGRHRDASTLRPSDWAKLRTQILANYKATTAKNIIIRIRSIFSWASGAGYLDKAPDYGKEFRVPSAKSIRVALSELPRLIFDAAALRELLDAATTHPQLRAMILLGINAGYGNTDCSELDMDHVHMDAEVVDFPRPKTGVPRRAILWPETVTALKIVLEQRKRLATGAHEYQKLVFLTKHKRPYVRRNSNGTEIDSVTTQFRKLMTRCGVYRPGLGFYSLRKTCRTVADETKDFPACDLIIGHIAADMGAPHSVEMAARYRGRIGDDRLSAVSSHIRQWLWPELHQ